MVQTVARDRYLLAAFRCSRAGKAITVGGLAAALGVTAPSACVMAKKLVSAGLLQRRDRGFALTTEGERRGMFLLRRHRLTECFLADMLGVSLAHVHEEAVHLEEALSAVVMARLAAKLRSAHTPGAANCTGCGACVAASSPGAMAETAVR